jgi:L-lactate dehydrogenase complex protein LldG
MTTDSRTTIVPEQGAGPEPLVERFAERAGALGVLVHRVAGPDEVAVLVAGLVERPGEERVVVAPGLAASQPALAVRLQAHELMLGEVDLADPSGSFARVAVGVSEAVLGLAETGSLVVADALPDRLVRMLSPKHVVVLGAAWVVPGLDEAGEFLRQSVAAGEGAPARYVSFITGPSRTADIEMSLTVGAHGPAELHVAILSAGQE